jgi:hypothetical protein
MRLGIPILSRFSANDRTEANTAQSEDINNVHSNPRSTIDSKAPCIETAVGVQVVEISDSEEESDWDAIAITPDETNSARTAR